MSRSNWIQIAFFLLISIPIFGQKDLQKPKVKFGDIAIEDFSKRYPIDSNANALILYDIGSTEFQGNQNSWFSIVFSRHVRIKIIDKAGFDASFFVIPLYQQDFQKEKILKLKASSFNLENGKIVETSLKDDAIYTDPHTKNIYLRKFAMPAVKAGTIIDVSYEVESDFLFNLQSWTFQSEDYPCLWSENTVELPEYFEYVVNSQGYLPYDIKKVSENRRTFAISVPTESISDRKITQRIEAKLKLYEWAIKDVPALKKEPYVTSYENHVSKVEFQLSSQVFPLSPVVDILGSWASLSNALKQSDDYWAHLSKPNDWLDQPIAGIVGNATTPLEKAKLIYTYVRDHFSSIDGQSFGLSKGIKTVWKDKKGEEADLNIMLLTMLQHIGITAYPVLASTRDFGYPPDIYPFVNRLNKVFCYVKIDQQIYYLDPSNRYAGFGFIDQDLYNGKAEVMTSNPFQVDIAANSVKEKKSVNLVFKSDANKGIWNYQGKMGVFESLDLREDIAKEGKENYSKKLQLKVGNEYSLSNLMIDSLSNPDIVLKVKYDLELPASTDALLYIEPFMHEGLKDNPFKSAHRKYPVEMPFGTDKLIVSTIFIPAGYVVDELPQDARVTLNEQDAAFEYTVSKDDAKVTVRTKITINNTFYPPEQYNNLREFYALIAKKHSEMVVFRKK
ncbi:MAG: DUF3857 domain-containing protein [Saprospiraceae bacterium]